MFCVTVAEIVRSKVVGDHLVIMLQFNNCNRCFIILNDSSLMITFPFCLLCLVNYCYISFNNGTYLAYWQKR